MGATTVSRPVAAVRRERAGGLLREQALVAAAQLGAGLGNLAFALVAIRVLAPADFALLVAFLALYLVVHVPAASLSAGSALRPALAAEARRRAWRIGGVIGGAVALCAVPLAPLLGLPVALVAALAVAVPAAGPLALERGRLYGAARHGRIAASLLAEPAARLAVGLPLAVAAGPLGAAAGVVAGSWLALLIARAGGAAPVAATGRPVVARDQRRAALITAGAFLAVALLQNQDVLLANARLAGGEAGRFAVLSTIGGVAAFATTTLPLVLLPRARAGARGALKAALAAAAALGVAAVLAVALAPDALFGAALGERYGDVRGLAVPYVGAMALFGITRVLVAEGCARGAAGRVAAALVAAAAAQAAGILVLGTSAASIAHVTLVAMAVAAGGAAVARLPRREREAGLRLRPRPSRAALAVGGLTVAALVLRLIATRSIWLDEATSITQAQLPLGGLLDSLRASDVHPPLHHLLLWVLAHTVGTAELVMRMPSILAGTALVPVVFVLGRELYDRRAGLVAAALTTVAPFAVWYSQEARMYALFMLFATLAVLAQLRALRRGERRDWVLYAVASAGLVWTQYFGLLILGVQQAAFAVAALRRHRAGEPVRGLLVGWLTATAVIVVATAPLVPFALDQFHANQAAGKGFGAPQQAGSTVDSTAHQPGVYVVLTNLVWAVWGYHSASTMAAVTALWPLGMLLALLLLGRGRSPRTLLVAACALVPAGALFVLGEAKPFLFEIRYFSGAVPLLLVLMARAATAWTAGRRVVGGAVVAALLASLSLAAADQQVNRSNPRLYDFEGTLATLRKRVRPGDVVLYEPYYLRDVVHYYAPDLRSAPLRDGVPSKRWAKRVFVMASFLDQPSRARRTAAAIDRIERTRPLRDAFRRPQIKVWMLR